MAFWVVDGGRSIGTADRGPFYTGGKRRVSYSEGSDGHGDAGYPKRARYGPGSSGCEGPDGPTYFGHHDHAPGYPHGRHHCRPGLSSALDDYDHYDCCRNHGRGSPNETPPPPDSIPIQNLSFLVIHERSPTPEPLPPSASGMERTASGLSISSDTSQISLDSLHDDENMMEDLEAARFMKEHVANFRRRNPDSQHARILKALINPKTRETDYALDENALRSIFIAANEVFFAKWLTGRVAWDWSHPDSTQYKAHIVGTTAVRRTQPKRYETLIVLSSPILKNTKYNRRLLISTFLHEMIHSFLFVRCGLKASHNGGHTEGFRQIAETIDDWIGGDHLNLRTMEADLDSFLGDVDIYGGHRCDADEERRILRGGCTRRRRDGRAERHRNVYHTNESYRPRQRPGHDGWHWNRREGFGARRKSARGPSYVY